VQVLDQPRRRVGVGGSAHEPRRLGDVPADQRQPHAGPTDRRQQAGLLRLVFAIPLAARPDDQQVRAVQVAGDEAEQQQRGVVRRLQVVEHHHQGRGLGGAAQERRDCVATAETARARCRVRAPPAVAADPGGRSRSSGSRCATWAAGAERRGELRVVEAARDVAEQHRPRPEGRRALAFPTARPGHARGAGRDDSLQLGGESRLADAGLTGDQEHAPAPGDGIAQAGLQLSQLPFTSDERAPRRAGCGRRSATHAARAPDPARRAAAPRAVSLSHLGSTTAATSLRLYEVWRST
jgi:hypothetical protein